MVYEVFYEALRNFDTESEPAAAERVGLLEVRAAFAEQPTVTIEATDQGQR
ncbi:hypothetical protein F5X71_29815 [Nocardia brasiliensis]|uniref:Uncharacterized protein n=1 Tax=Nocardia brasiliensis TaxID=37326 RepID=A0A6G9XYD9_NOCBR|nr:hypothetical protein [Nocardia brasiliensis]QIS05948.1 hypothetical protein F5X71_29815 [Nocardia brasiliensis]